MQGSLSTVGLSVSSTQIVPKVNMKLVSKFNELISSDQLSPQQIHCRYYNGSNIPPHNTHLRHMALLYSWISVHCLTSETLSFMWNSEFHTNSALWNAIFHTMNLMFHNMERELIMFYYDH